MSDPIISLHHVSKCFKRYGQPADRLKEILLPGKSRAQEFWALRDIHLDIERGSTLGIVGQNGSGKSTLLQIVAGTLTPTTGRAEVRGRVSALLELGSGFNPEFTGRQNVFFNGRILGLTQAEIEARFDSIAAFADIGDFLDQPVKTYSSGMFVRLAFAVATSVDPDVLIVDEALAVGDIFFQAKCFQRLKRLQDDGITILFVSHDTATVQSLCSEGVLLHHGEMVAYGEPSLITSKYYQIFRQEHEQLPTIAPETKPETDIDSAIATPVEDDRPPIAVSFENRITNGKATVREIYITDVDDRAQDTFRSGETLKGRLVVEFYETCYDVTVGLALRDRYGSLLAGKHTWYDDPGPLPIVQKGETIECTFHLGLSLRGGEYLGFVGIATQRDENDYDCLDVVQDAFIIKIIGKNQNWGLAQIGGQIDVKSRSGVIYEMSHHLSNGSSSELLNHAE